MSEPISSFRLTPNYLKGGGLAVVRAEWVAGKFLDQPCTVELLEVDPEGGQGDLVAKFSAKLTGADGQFQFSDVQRLSVPADDPDDMELPGPKADTSKDGSYTYPREITWRRAHLELQLDGDSTKHLVILRSAASRDMKTREGMRYELALRVSDAGGAPIFAPGDQFSTVDCWEALIANCVEAVINQYEGHVGMCEARPREGGDYYGSSCSAKPSGKTSTDCVTYVLQVLDRAYGECRAAADARYLRNNASMGAYFAPALFEAGWGLVLCVKDVKEVEGYRDYSSTVLRKAADTGTLWGKPVELLADYAPNGSWDATTNEWTEPQPDRLASRRYDELGERVPFGICALGLGSHVVMKVGPALYECHWGSPATSSNLFDRSDSWESLKQQETIFWMAAPLFALRPPPLKPIEPIRPKLFEIELPPLQLKPIQRLQLRPIPQGG